MNRNSADRMHLGLINILIVPFSIERWLARVNRFASPCSRHHNTWTLFWFSYFSLATHFRHRFVVSRPRLCMSTQWTSLTIQKDKNFSLILIFCQYVGIRQRTSHITNISDAEIRSDTFSTNLSPHPKHQFLTTSLKLWI